MRPKPGLETGTEIRNRATIVFDANPRIETAEWLNTVDNAKPSSHVDSVGSPGQDGLPVYWSGTDQGAGLYDYTAFVSENAGSFTPWLVTPDPSANFVGTCGKSYAFYIVARDLVGNVEDALVRRMSWRRSRAATWP